MALVRLLRVVAASIAVLRTAFMKIGVLDSKGTYDVRLKAYGGAGRQELLRPSRVTPYDETNQNVEHSGFNFESEHRGGWYRFCLDNMHDGSDDLGEEDKLDEQTRQEHMEGVKTSLDRLQTLLKLIRNEQD
ncbi:hypothetical protein GQ600_4594 [Phytophthora cactorum]|nr:hypothetical protein GQ600_4594 [Phytophthora cactorum]